MNEDASARFVFHQGEHALIIDRRGRRYLALLRPGAKFESHLGAFEHDALIGAEAGSWMTTNRGHVLLAVKPTMADFALEMPRIATVGYPKDLGAILVYGDIFPGARVLEAGCGSGAVTMALLRAIGEHGSLISYDVRQDMIDRTHENVSTMLADTSNLTLKLGDVYDGFEERELDRVVLDLPEPWLVVPHASESLLPGGIFISFSPTVLQVHELVRTLRAAHTFDMMETMEVLQRPWNVSARSVRPEHRMVAHTGFITVARRCSPRPVSKVSNRA
jgi:tRNA (adenine57-N1/adenine58-N1)-methyltransferase